ncbi:MULTISPECIES: outer membrane beta-barrel protein [unclassified Bartonella]|uniref:outer membrane beta-barrel protein n=1 Tax=unclassified Bartonella TaxID=2645622 RepID=UPI000999B0A0|nr:MULTISPECIES: outer membrane beta-barrel protein [unclassified Bartonella]AQX27491.1 outer membrane immunogenic protein [Bartonella sp. JB15]AQX28772.1 outer membrane immunogenic protein [Bartonella sp. JB63]
MNIKFLLTIFTIVSVYTSTVQASESILFQESNSSAADSKFSWTGFYIGGQVAGFSSKVTANALNIDIPLSSEGYNSVDRWASVDKKHLPQLFGMRGGIYAGSDINLGNNLIIGVDTDIMWSGQEDTKTVIVGDDLVPRYRSAEGNEAVQERPRVIISPLSTKNLGRAMYHHVARSRAEEGQYVFFNHTLKEKWTGATRVRIGFAADRIMPYVAGGISYVDLQDTLSVVMSKENKVDESKTMIGYTFGGGVDFALNNNIIVRTEYRYSDFGKKKFAREEIDLSYKTNDFRVGVAYKF